MPSLPSVPIILVAGILTPIQVQANDRFLYESKVSPTNSSHCHIDWHLVAGMVAQFVEAPFEIQKRIQVPSIVSDQCTAQGIPISGPGVGTAPFYASSG